MQWHLFKNETPKRTGTYLVTIESSCFGDRFEQVELADWIGGNFLVRNANFHKSGVIVAWMLCPEPCRQEAKDE